LTDSFIKLEVEMIDYIIWQLRECIYCC